METTTVLPISLRAWISRRIFSEANASPPGLLIRNTTALMFLSSAIERNFSDRVVAPIVPCGCVPPDDFTLSHDDHHFLRLVRPALPFGQRQVFLEIQLPETLTAFACRAQAFQLQVGLRPAHEFVDQTRGQGQTVQNRRLQLPGGQRNG